jgi:hypothetical protein
MPNHWRRSASADGRKNCLNGNVASRLSAFHRTESLYDFDLIWRRDFYLRLPFVKLDSSGYADDFALERGDTVVTRHFRISRNEPG